MKLANKLIIIILLFGCASAKDPDDPIKNSRKLVIEGHKSLYDNGAFAVKGTSIKFIPPFSEAEVFILGRRCRFSKRRFFGKRKKSW
jgi:hypothetical protein